MKKLLLAAAVITSVVFIGCKSKGGGDPKEVLMSFFDAMSKKDMKTVRDLSTKESESMISMLEMGMKDEKASDELSKYDRTKMEFGEPVISGDNAKVPVKDKASGETLNYPMKKVGGQWKVAFDKSSMMQMGMEKMGDKSENIGDTATKALEEMKNMNMDSVSNEINKTVDSANRAQ